MKKTLTQKHKYKIIYTAIIILTTYIIIRAFTIT